MIESPILITVSGDIIVSNDWAFCLQQSNDDSDMINKSFFKLNTVYDLPSTTITISPFTECVL